MIRDCSVEQPRMQLDSRDYLVEQPVNGYKKFLKSREKTLRPSNAEASKKQDKKSQTDYQANTGQEDRNDLQQTRHPQRNHQFYYTG